MRRIIAVALAGVVASAAVWAQKKEEERLQECATVIKEILDIPDGIPGLASISGRVCFSVLNERQTNGVCQTLRSGQHANRRSSKDHDKQDAQVLHGETSFPQKQSI